jgi:CDGSH-type Zn-finger protein
VSDGAPGIVIRENGPYVVTRIPLHDAAGTPYEPKEVYALCRCGGSSNKPFCDGTHRTRGEWGAETADRRPIRERRRAYAGEGITVYDDRSLCAHFGHCTDALPQVFGKREGEDGFCRASGAGAGEIAAVVRTCPSGALTYSLPGSDGAVEESRAPVILPSRDGPYVLTGGIQVTAADGFSYERRARMALCRCGQSGNKPFCDGTHWTIGFEAVGLPSHPETS